MTRHRARADEVEKRPLVVVFGESENDRRAIVHIVRGLRPDLDRVVEERRQPLVLIKGALPHTARSNAESITAIVRQEAAARDVLAVLAHQDCDALEPAHEAAASKIEAAFVAARCPAPTIGVTPAWEIEAWWMVFPEAVGKTVKGWRNPDDWLGKDVGRVQNAKQKLAEAVQPRPKPARPPRAYEERDSITIAENVARGGLLASFHGGRRATPHSSGTEVHTRSASFERFRQRVLGIRRAG